MHSCLLSAHVHTAAVHPLGDVPILFAPICGETCVAVGWVGLFEMLCEVFESSTFGLSRAHSAAQCAGLRRYAS